jgi:hypothetical protein
LGNEKKVRIEKSFTGLTLHFFYPIVNTHNGAISVIKTSMKSKNKSYEFELSSISLINPEVFAQSFGEEYFTIESTRKVPLLVSSWPLIEREIKLYNNEEITKVENTLSVLEPMSQNMPPVTGHFMVDHFLENKLPKK